MFSYVFGVKPKGEYINDKTPSEYPLLERQYNGAYILGRPAYAGYLRSLNEGIAPG